MKTPTDRTYKICSPEVLEEDLTYIKNTLPENSYPEKFIEKNMMRKLKSNPIPTVSKKLVFISLPFHIDALSDNLEERILKRRFLLVQFSILMAMLSAELLGELFRGGERWNQTLWRTVSCIFAVRSETCGFYNLIGTLNKFSHSINSIVDISTRLEPKSFHNLTSSLLS